MVRILFGSSPVPRSWWMACHNCYAAWLGQPPPRRAGTGHSSLPVAVAFACRCGCGRQPAKRTRPGASRGANRISQLLHALHVARGIPADRWQARRQRRTTPPGGVRKRRASPLSGVRARRRARGPGARVPESTQRPERWCEGGVMVTCASQVVEAFGGALRGVGASTRCDFARRSSRTPRDFASGVCQRRGIPPGRVRLLPGAKGPRLRRQTWGFRARRWRGAREAGARRQIVILASVVVRGSRKRGRSWFSQTWSFVILASVVVRDSRERGRSQAWERGRS